MKIGIMQPYIFPYIGYFQLIHSVERFVFYDDVTYIKQGWINRNRILLGCNPHMFTLPLKNASSFQLISETELNKNLYAAWLNKFSKTLESAYQKAPHYQPVAQLINDVMHTDVQGIAALAVLSVKSACEYIGLRREMIDSSTIYNNGHLHAAERVVDICKREQGTVYINPIGGQELYNRPAFEASGLELYFVKSRPVVYPQGKCEFVPWLSIIDVMMHLPKDRIQEELNNYDLV